jgi:hypothetical protein
VSFINELQEKLSAKGAASFGVTWGPGADALSAEERARCVLAVEWDADRYGVSYDHWECPWWHFDCFAKEAASKARRLADKLRGVRNPYAQERDNGI